MDLLKRDDLPPSQEEDLASERAKAAVKDFVTKTRQGLLAETRLQGAMTLAQFVNNSYGIEAAMLGKHLRQQRAIAFVLQLLYEGEVKLQRIGLMLVSNLCSDAFDPKSAETKRQVQHASVFERIKDFVYSPDTVAQVYALACLQNLSKDVAFARLIRDYELVEELERLVQETENPNLKRFAAGTLYNTVEAIHRQTQLRSLDRLTAQSAMDPSDPTPPVRKRGSSVMSAMFQEQDQEVELSDEVLQEIGKREAMMRSEERARIEAASIIQSVVRTKRTTRAFRTLQQMAHAVRIVTRFVRTWQRKRRRKAALMIQAHARSSICDRVGVCSYRTLLITIRGLQEAYLRCIVRMVYKRLALIRLELKQRQAAEIYDNYNAARRVGRSPQAKAREVGDRSRKPLFRGRGVFASAGSLRLTMFPGKRTGVPIVPTMFSPGMDDDEDDEDGGEVGAMEQGLQQSPHSETASPEVESRLTKAAAAEAVLNISVSQRGDAEEDDDVEDGGAGAFAGVAIRRLIPPGQESAAQYAAFSNLTDVNPASPSSASGLGGPGAARGMRGSSSYSGLPSARAAGSNSEGGPQAVRLGGSMSMSTLPQRSSSLSGQGSRKATPREGTTSMTSLPGRLSGQNSARTYTSREETVPEDAAVDVLDEVEAANIRMHQSRMSLAPPSGQGSARSVKYTPREETVPEDAVVDHSDETVANNAGVVQTRMSHVPPSVQGSARSVKYTPREETVPEDAVVDHSDETVTTNTGIVQTRMSPRTLGQSSARRYTPREGSVPEDAAVGPSDKTIATNLGMVQTRMSPGLLSGQSSARSAKYTPREGRVPEHAAISPSGETITTNLGMVQSRMSPGMLSGQSSARSAKYTPRDPGSRRYTPREDATADPSAMMSSRKHTPRDSSSRKYTPRDSSNKYKVGDGERDEDSVSPGVRAPASLDALES